LALIGSLLLKLREILSFPSSRVQQSKSSWIAGPLKMRPIDCLETSVSNSHSQKSKVFL